MCNFQEKQSLSSHIHANVMNIYADLTFPQMHHAVLAVSVYSLFYMHNKDLCSGWKKQPTLSAQQSTARMLTAMKMDATL